MSLCYFQAGLRIRQQRSLSTWENLSGEQTEGCRVRRGSITARKGVAVKPLLLQGWTSPDVLFTSDPGSLASLPALSPHTWAFCPSAQCIHLSGSKANTSPSKGLVPGMASDILTFRKQNWHLCASPHTSFSKASSSGVPF